ncbi:DUF4394 domain-containing protein [Luteolibacter yonseiensis]|uniref:DUF4394 domain-containing protein n=1 Tax=Luteolibacter yonseiensis TaxID=1144680 RepID=A0A934R3I5_9BACT|nr:DUF4394 domain-containing protein [Luteolibacter yonseiensis]MBK1814564.1 DUF4394 domain-containing protein [Luteolibacter yonseiensis]
MSLKSTITAAIASGILAGSSHAITIYGLGPGGQLYSFDSASPGTVNAVGAATVGGIVDIDFRGSDNRLYGLSATGTTSTINTLTGAATVAFSPSHTLGGNVSGFDFNPAADRMRIAVGGTNNFRMVPSGIPGMTAGTVVNGATGGDGLFSVAPGISVLDVAYTNPFNGAAGTTLFSIGSDGMLYSHPMAGAPTFNNMLAVGSLGIPVAGDVGFDIAADGTGYLVSGNNFYTVNLTSGLATSVGTLGQNLTSITVVPEPGAIVLVSVVGLGLLRRNRTR